MKTDKNGCSTCPCGSEQYEEYYDRFARKNKVQYDYRTLDGKLFSCIASTIEEAQARKNTWLAKRGLEQ
jgi:hypothetical protein